MTPEELEAELLRRRKALEEKMRAQAAELKAQKRGPWSPSVEVRPAKLLKMRRKR